MGITPEKFSNLEMLTGEFQRILDTNINTVRGSIFQEEFFKFQYWEVRGFSHPASGDGSADGL
jgi:hypothetical protein